VAHVLIVDDDPVVSLTLARMLEWAGHDVARADSPHAGLDHAASAPPAAILLDMRMPGMSGAEFLRELRRRPALSTTPVGIVTGDYFMDEQILIELAGLGAVVRYKPMWMDDLVELMATLLGNRPAVAEP
jgi:CheY-like chemotaxis protein